MGGGGICNMFIKDVVITVPLNPGAVGHWFWGFRMEMSLLRLGGISYLVIL